MSDLGFGGYADVTDPRTRYDDLIEDRSEEQLDRESFVEACEMEAFRSGWVGAGVVVDDADRVLLVHEPGADHWLLPGGTIQRGETLAGGLRREIDEEAGVDVTPVRPHAVAEHVVRHDGEWTGFAVGLIEARPESTELGTDLGVDDEEIDDAGWFESLPTRTFQRDLATRALERVRAE
ncbi:ADP-ribose pyrophosphatase [Halovivax ruber XH-70]|uniref:ADP-ribose pyrophosphatase n=1 Tax=Halovivax ruber (strain DSM 18193 / JCM 13892 / XH-70) TaxID=797302 RepID=L0I6B3_HALRX|nr:NUDIX hydrolase [Halovivax ruber]AGB15085.1 ADP-ribose pyrophosphatase [Halovivax ruber XH-70]